MHTECVQVCVQERWGGEWVLTSHTKSVRMVSSTVLKTAPRCPVH